jgi:hypothetical protein
MKGNIKEDGASALRKGLSVLSCFSWQKAVDPDGIAREVNFHCRRPTTTRLSKKRLFWSGT